MVATFPHQSICPKKKVTAQKPRVPISVAQLGDSIGGPPLYSLIYCRPPAPKGAWGGGKPAGPEAGREALKAADHVLSICTRKDIRNPSPRSRPT